MSERCCPSCGAENPLTAIYCGGCKGLLPVTPAATGTQHQPSRTAPVAVPRPARLRAKKTNQGTSLASRLKGLFFYLFSVALGVAVVLALLSPKETAPQAAPVPGSPAVVQRAMANARIGSSTLTQPVINEFLHQQGNPGWAAPFPWIPVPRWTGSRVNLTPGRVTYDLDLTLFGHPLHASETFAITGSPGSWSLQAETGSFGLLPLPPAALPLLTLLMGSSAQSLDHELGRLAAARILLVGPGMIEFSAP